MFYDTKKIEASRSAVAASAAEGKGQKGLNNAVQRRLANMSAVKGKGKTSTPSTGVSATGGA